MIVRYVIVNRIEILRKHIDEILLNMTDVEERRCAYLHLYGVASVLCINCTKAPGKC